MTATPHCPRDNSLTVFVRSRELGGAEVWVCPRCGGRIRSK